MLPVPFAEIGMLPSNYKKLNIFSFSFTPIYQQEIGPLRTRTALQIYIVVKLAVLFAQVDRKITVEKEKY